MKDKIVEQFLKDNILDGNIKVKADIPGVTKSYILLSDLLSKFASHLYSAGEDKIVEILKYHESHSVNNKEEISTPAVFPRSYSEIATTIDALYSAGEEVFVPMSEIESFVKVYNHEKAGKSWSVNSFLTGLNNWLKPKLTRPIVSDDHYRKAVEWIDGMITCPENVADFKTRAYRIAQIAAGPPTHPTISEVVHEKELRNIISGAMDSLAMEFVITGRQDIDIGDHVNELITKLEYLVSQYPNDADLGATIRSEVTKKK